MLNLLKRVILLLLGSLALIGGAFLAIAGGVSGFGNHSFIAKAGYIIGGILLFALGWYCYYLGSNKNLPKMLDDILMAIINGF